MSTTHFVPNAVIHNGWVPCRTLDEDAAYRDVWEHNVYQLGEEHLRDAVVIDIGSNVGFFTAFALHNGARYVVAVDPVEEHHERAQAMLGDRDDVIYLVAAAGDGCARTFGPGEGPSQTMVTLPVVSSDDPAPQVIGGVTLDELLVTALWPFPDETPRVIVKVDCEGCEYELVDYAEWAALDRVWRFVGEWHGRMGARLASAEGLIGQMVERLLWTHSVSIYGYPDTGGQFYAMHNGGKYRP